MFAFFLQQWVPKSSQLLKNKQEYNSYFGSTPLKLNLLISQTGNGNLLTPTNIDTIYEIFKLSLNFTIEYNNTQYSFNDLCEREYYIGSLNCTSITHGFFNIFDYNPQLWQNQTVLNQQLIKHESILNVCKKTR